MLNGDIAHIVPLSGKTVGVQEHRVSRFGGNGFFRVIKRLRGFSELKLNGCHVVVGASVIGTQRKGFMKETLGGLKIAAGAVGRSHFTQGMHISRFNFQRRFIIPD
ncbi:MAG: hypothetical protein BWY20_02341 [Spirochaetes bacterium ADurb.Bin215]|nr:MAG: hypothetical protein BWY20_02341 [Spirochaetes bacterium ADurb.Bin215]